MGGRKGWRKSQRKNPSWWPAVIDYLKENSNYDNPKPIKTIIAEAKTKRHGRERDGSKQRYYSLCASRICPQPRDIAYVFRIRKIPFHQPKKGAREYYLEENYEIED